MVAGTEILSGYVVQNIYEDGGGVCDTPPPDSPVAKKILQSFDIPISNVEGGRLYNYDIKAQDSLTMLKLSLLEEAWTGSSASTVFKEVYINNEGTAQTVNINNTRIPSSAFAGTNSVCVVKSSIYEQDSDENKIDHVIVRGGDPLPFKRHSDNTVNVMGDAGGVVQPDTDFSCGLTNFIKSTALDQESWAVFQQSPQSQEIKDRLREAINREEWEQSLGYKQKLPLIPPTASISPTQTSPVNLNMNFSGRELTYTLPLGSPEPGFGGVVDISNVNLIGAQVLDIQTGKDLKDQVSEFPAPDVPDRYGLTTDDLYVLLDDTCTVIGLSRGQNWFLLPGSINAAQIQIRRAEGSAISYKAFGGLTGAEIGTTVYYFRRTSQSITSMSDFVLSNVKGEIPPTFFEFDPNIPSFTQGVPRMMFDTTYGANETAFPGRISPGFGNNGTEIFSLFLSYTIQKPAIQVRTAYGGSRQLAAQIAAAGIHYTPIIVVDAPAPIGYKGRNGFEDPVEQVPPAEDENPDPQCPETILDTLEGTIVDISAPFLGEDAVGPAAEKVYDFILNDDGEYHTLSYTFGGHTILPGMRWQRDDVTGVVHSVEFVYSDKESVSTNVTIGPAYYEANSYSDSKYVRRSVHLTRTATVIQANNATGEFIVDVDGIGVFNSFNGLLDSVYPGDRVEVKINNFVVEP